VYVWKCTNPAVIRTRLDLRVVNRPPPPIAPPRPAHPTYHLLSAQRVGPASVTQSRDFWPVAPVIDPPWCAPIDLQHRLECFIAYSCRRFYVPITSRLVHEVVHSQLQKHVAMWELKAGPDSAVESKLAQNSLRAIIMFMPSPVHDLHL